MKVTRDADVCQACGHCALLAPELFELNPGDDVVTVRLDLVPAGQEATAQEAVDCCPSGALEVL